MNDCIIRLPFSLQHLFLYFISDSSLYAAGVSAQFPGSEVLQASQLWLSGRGMSRYLNCSVDIHISVWIIFVAFVAGRAVDHLHPSDKYIITRL